MRSVKSEKSKGELNKAKSKKPMVEANKPKYKSNEFIINSPSPPMISKPATVPVPHWTPLNTPPSAISKPPSIKYPSDKHALPLHPPPVYRALSSIKLPLDKCVQPSHAPPIYQAPLELPAHHLSLEPHQVPTGADASPEPLAHMMQPLPGTIQFHHLRISSSLCHWFPLTKLHTYHQTSSIMIVLIICTTPVTWATEPPLASLHTSSTNQWCTILYKLHISPLKKGVVCLNMKDSHHQWLAIVCWWEVEVIRCRCRCIWEECPCSGQEEECTILWWHMQVRATSIHQWWPNSGSQPSRRCSMLLTILQLTTLQVLQNMNITMLSSWLTYHCSTGFIILPLCHALIDICLFAILDNLATCHLLLCIDGCL